MYPYYILVCISVYIFIELTIFFLKMSVYFPMFYTNIFVVRKPVFGISDRSDTNRAVQPQKMARGLKFRI